MSKPLIIQSHTGPYEAHFTNTVDFAEELSRFDNAHFIVDKRVADLYASRLASVLETPSVLLVDADEGSKSLERFPGYVQHLVARGLRRNHTLVAIGGGIIQDITCFLAATMLRGVAWHFYPSTLLAQADSCIGSKSSINCGTVKNILGTFTPPKRIVISSEFLRTLTERDVRSGVGEILKVHAIEGPDAFDTIARDYEELFIDDELMTHYIHRALEIKKSYIERDEFDRGPRNIFNYGHSFGHAIEAATEFAIPHGIAVTIGMDMANHAAAHFGIADHALFKSRHEVLLKNFHGFEQHPIPIGRVIDALDKDKKNIGANQVTLILPDANGRIFKDHYPNDENFQTLCADYLNRVRAA